LRDGLQGGIFKFSVNAKVRTLSLLWFDWEEELSVFSQALLSPLRPRSANTIESCSIVVGSEDPTIPLEPGVDAGECRIIIRLHCQHGSHFPLSPPSLLQSTNTRESITGVVKTHRLTYGNPNVNNWARFDKNHCDSSWKASSKILKEWSAHPFLSSIPLSLRMQVYWWEEWGKGACRTDHFYLRSGTHALTDEITFYCSPLACRLKSFGDASSEQSELFPISLLTARCVKQLTNGESWADMTENEIMTSRPLTTELMVDTEDYDLWSISSSQIITFALKEFKVPSPHLSSLLLLSICADSNRNVS